MHYKTTSINILEKESTKFFSQTSGKFPSSISSNQEFPKYFWSYRFASYNKSEQKWIYWIIYTVFCRKIIAYTKTGKKWLVKNLFSMKIIDS